MSMQSTTCTCTCNECPTRMLNFTAAQRGTVSRTTARVVGLHLLQLALRQQLRVLLYTPAALLCPRPARHHVRDEPHSCKVEGNVLASQEAVLYRLVFREEVLEVDVRRGLGVERRQQRVAALLCRLFKQNNNTTQSENRAQPRKGPEMHERTVKISVRSALICGDGSTCSMRM